MKDASADLKNSLIDTPSSPDPMLGGEDSGEEEIYTDSLTSHTTASDSTPADLLTSTASAVEDISNIPLSLIENQFSTVSPILRSLPSLIRHRIVFSLINLANNLVTLSHMILYLQVS